VAVSLAALGSLSCQLCQHSREVKAKYYLKEFESVVFGFGGYDGSGTLPHRIGLLNHQNPTRLRSQCSARAVEGRRQHLRQCEEECDGLLFTETRGYSQSRLLEDHCGHARIDGILVKCEGQVVEGLSQRRNLSPLRSHSAVPAANLLNISRQIFRKLGIERDWKTAHSASLLGNLGWE
jgi:hypothetical protein